MQQHAGQTSVAVNQIELDLLRTLPTNKYYDKPDAQGVSNSMTIGNLVLPHPQATPSVDNWEWPGDEATFNSSQLNNALFLHNYLSSYSN